MARPLWAQAIVGRSNRSPPRDARDIAAQRHRADLFGNVRRPAIPVAQFDCQGFGHDFAVEGHRAIARRYPAARASASLQNISSARITP